MYRHCPFDIMDNCNKQRTCRIIDYIEISFFYSSHLHHVKIISSSITTNGWCRIRNLLVTVSKCQPTTHHVCCSNVMGRRRGDSTNYDKKSDNPVNKMIQNLFPEFFGIYIAYFIHRNLLLVVVD